METGIEPRLGKLFHTYLRACRRLRIERETDGLLGRLGAIEDPEIRLYRFGERLRNLPAEEAAWTLARVQERVADGDWRARRIGFGLLDKSRLERVLSPEGLQAVAEALQARGHPGALLFGRTPRTGGAGDDGILAPPKEPVGYRISLARRAMAGMLERLLFDPDPRVVRALLGNPRVTEADVVKLAASRRAGPQALEAIAQDDRWIVRYAIKVALANNPTAPIRIVIGLLPYLMHQDLRTLSASSSREDVRIQAAALLARRSGT
jgi:hypothetical protein